MDVYYRRLPLTGLHNARDLGGYPTRSGKTTQFARFVRSEVPKSLTQEDMDFLRGYGIKTSVDFRGPNEIERHPSQLQNLDWIVYRSCPAFNKQVAMGSSPEALKMKKLDAFVKWSEKYCEMLDMCRDWVKDTLEFMSDCPGCVLFHCTTGKDRTGIVSALLLSLAGVPDPDIIADYCVSQIYLVPVYEQLQGSLPAAHEDGTVDFSDPFFRTEPENMALMMKYINDSFGSTEAYVKACGVSQNVIDRLRSRLLD